MIDICDKVLYISIPDPTTVTRINYPGVNYRGLLISLTLRPGNTGNIFLQLARNNVALQVENVVARITTHPQTLSRNKISLLQVEAACCSKLNWRLLFSTKFFNLQQQNFVA